MQHQTTANRGGVGSNAHGSFPTTAAAATTVAGVTISSTAGLNRNTITKAIRAGGNGTPPLGTSVSTPPIFAPPPPTTPAFSPSYLSGDATATTTTTTAPSSSSLRHETTRDFVARQVSTSADAVKTYLFKNLKSLAESAARPRPVPKGRPNLPANAADHEQYTMINWVEELDGRGESSEEEEKWRLQQQHQQSRNASVGANGGASSSFRKRRSSEKRDSWHQQHNANNRNQNNNGVGGGGGSFYDSDAGGYLSSTITTNRRRAVGSGGGASFNVGSHHHRHRRRKKVFGGGGGHASQSSSGDGDGSDGSSDCSSNVSGGSSSSSSVPSVDYSSFSAARRNGGRDVGQLNQQRQHHISTPAGSDDDDDNIRPDRVVATNKNADFDAHNNVPAGLAMASRESNDEDDFNNNSNDRANFGGRRSGYTSEVIQGSEGAATANNNMPLSNTKNNNSQTATPRSHRQGPHERRRRRDEERNGLLSHEGSSSGNSPLSVSQVFGGGGASGLRECFHVFRTSSSTPYIIRYLIKKGPKKTAIYVYLFLKNAANSITDDFIYNMQMWLAAAVLGILCALTAAVTEVGTQWLSDLKLGHCSLSFWASETACCRLSNNLLLEEKQKKQRQQQQEAQKKKNNKASAAATTTATSASPSAVKTTIAPPLKQKSQKQKARYHSSSQHRPFDAASDDGEAESKPSEIVETPATTTIRNSEDESSSNQKKSGGGDPPLSNDKDDRDEDDEDNDAKAHEERDARDREAQLPEGAIVNDTTTTTTTVTPISTPQPQPSPASTPSSTSGLTSLVGGDGFVFASKAAEKQSNDGRGGSSSGVSPSEGAAMMTVTFDATIPSAVNSLGDTTTSTTGSKETSQPINSNFGPPGLSPTSATPETSAASTTRQTKTTLMPPTTVPLPPTTTPTLPPTTTTSTTTTTTPAPQVVVPVPQCAFYVEWNHSAGDATGLSGLVMYTVLAVLFATISGYLCYKFAPLAAGSGIVEMKTILSGVRIPHFLDFRVYVVKSVGLMLSVGSGMTLGKEGPFVHLGCCLANLTAKLFPRYRNSEAQQRELLSSGAAAGVAVAFGAPIGGVLFSLEEVSYYFPHRTMLQAFFAAIVANIVLTRLDVNHNGRAVQLSTTFYHTQSWHWFELGAFALLGAVGGLVGCFINWLNSRIVLIRRQQKNHQIVEIAITALFTALLAYLTTTSRYGMLEVIGALFSECESTSITSLDLGGGGNGGGATSQQQNAAGATYGASMQKERVFSPFHTSSDGSSNSGGSGSGAALVFTSPLKAALCHDSDAKTIMSLLYAAIIRTLLMALTFGMKLPAGCFVPSLFIGACMGRIAGMWSQNSIASYLVSAWSVIVQSAENVSGGDATTAGSGGEGFFDGGEDGAGGFAKNLMSTLFPSVVQQCLSRAGGGSVGAAQASVYFASMRNPTEAATVIAHDCINPAIYAAVGAAAVLAGVTRMTICLVVIMLEVIGGLDHIVPCMVAVVVAKWVADSSIVGIPSIYDVHLQFTPYPFIDPKEEFNERGGGDDDEEGGGGVTSGNSGRHQRHRRDGRSKHKIQDNQYQQQPRRKRVRDLVAFIISTRKNNNNNIVSHSGTTSVNQSATTTASGPGRRSSSSATTNRNVRSRSGTVAIEMERVPSAIMTTTTTTSSRLPSATLAAGGGVGAMVAASNNNNMHNQSTSSDGSPSLAATINRLQQQAQPQTSTAVTSQQQLQHFVFDDFLATTMTNHNTAAIENPTTTTTSAPAVPPSSGIIQSSTDNHRNPDDVAGGLDSVMMNEYVIVNDAGSSGVVGSSPTPPPPLGGLVVLWHGITLGEVTAILEETDFNHYPVVSFHHSQQGGVGAATTSANPQAVVANNNNHHSSGDASPTMTMAHLLPHSILGTMARQDLIRLSRRAVFQRAPQGTPIHFMPQSLFALSGGGGGGGGGRVGGATCAINMVSGESHHIVNNSGGMVVPPSPTPAPFNAAPLLTSPNNMMGSMNNTTPPPLDWSRKMDNCTISVTMDMSIQRLLHTFKALGNHQVLVAHPSGKLEGIVTRKDLMLYVKAHAHSKHYYNRIVLAEQQRQEQLRKAEEAERRAAEEFEEEERQRRLAEEAEADQLFFGEGEENESNNNHNGGYSSSSPNDQRRRAAAATSGVFTSALFDIGRGGSYRRGRAGAPSSSSAAVGERNTVLAVGEGVGRAIGALAVGAWNGLSSAIRTATMVPPPPQPPSSTTANHSPTTTGNASSRR